MVPVALRVTLSSQPSPVLISHPVLKPFAIALCFSPCWLGPSWTQGAGKIRGRRKGSHGGQGTRGVLVQPGGSRRGEKQKGWKQKCLKQKCLKQTPQRQQSEKPALPFPIAAPPQLSACHHVPVLFLYIVRRITCLQRFPKSLGSVWFFLWVVCYHGPRHKPHISVFILAWCCGCFSTQVIDSTMYPAWRADHTYSLRKYLNSTPNQHRFPCPEHVYSPL